MRVDVTVSELENPDIAVHSTITIIQHLELRSQVTWDSSWAQPKMCKMSQLKMLNN